MEEDSGPIEEHRRNRSQMDRRGTRAVVIIVDIKKDNYLTGKKRFNS